MKVPGWFDRHMAYRGPCGFTGNQDARSRILDDIVDRAMKNEDLGDIGRDYGIPEGAVLRLVWPIANTGPR